MASLRELLLEVRDANGGQLTPQAVVDAARSDDHPLHHRFEWDDSVAGEAYRRQQAQDLIRKVKIRFLPAEGPSQAVRAFHAVRTPEGSHVYEDVEKVIEDPITRRLLLREMERDWRALRKRWENFSEFWQMVQDELAEAS